MKARCHSSLPVKDEFATHLLLHPEGMYIETASGRRSKANNKLNLRPRKRDELSVAVELVDEDVRHSERSRCARRDALAVV
jgi:hypothetical protein